MQKSHQTDYKWLTSGEEAIGQMLAAIGRATKSVRFEMYIFHSGRTGDEFRTALVKACQRGLDVQVLVDALGSAYLPDSFWNTLRDAEENSDGSIQ